MTMIENVGRAGGCEWFSDDSRVQYARCHPCMWSQCPGGVHDWADKDDRLHALINKSPDPAGQKCGCTCADGPILEPEEFEPDESLNMEPCPLCDSEGACGYDADGRPLIHALPEDE